MKWIKELQGFLIPTRKAETGGQDTNNLLSQRRHRNHVKQDKPRTDDRPSATTRRHSIFKPISSTFKKGRAKELPDVPTQGEKSEKSPRNETLQQLLHEIGSFSDNNTRLKAEVNAKEAELENLKGQGGESGWKDGLYEQRMKEHASAQASINTGSASVDISKLVRQLNDEIAAIATLATRTPAKDPRRGSTGSIPQLLGERFSMSFPHSDNCLEVGLARALLQIFLAQRCETVIHSWRLGNPEFDEIFSQFYDRISNKGEQSVLHYFT
jgi:hypothetical protein